MSSKSPITAESKMNGPQMLTGSKDTTIKGGTFQVANKIVNSTTPHTFQKGLDLLFGHVALGAFHNSAERFDPPKCYPKTREAIIAKIKAWVEERVENGERLVLWMYGPAGAGKSAIAQSIAELCEALLAASFFFSRPAEGRSDSSQLVATIVWQLIMTIPEMRDTVLSSLERDPTILSRTQATQMKVLLVDPLNRIPKETLKQHPCLVIIDGLDCLPTDSQNDVLKLLSTYLPQLNTPLYFFVASRPCSNIRKALDLFRPLIDTLPLEDDYQSIKDIRHFFTSSFEEMRNEHPHLPRSWPQMVDIEYLVRKSSGHFIYASTVIRYVTQGRHGHENRLQTFLPVQSHNNLVTPFTMLDTLYLSILQSVGKCAVEKVLQVLCALICLEEYHGLAVLKHLEAFFDYTPGELASVMGDMLSLIGVPARPSENVKIYHASFPDFLLDRSRSRSFYLDPAKRYLDLARRCLKDNLSRSSTTFDQNCGRGLPRHAYTEIFWECIHAPPVTEGHYNFLLESSCWDDIPASFSFLFQPDISDISMALLDRFREQHQHYDVGWAQTYEEKLRSFDRRVYQAFFTIPCLLQPMILAAFDIYMLINLKNPGLSVINLMVLRSFASDLGLDVNEFDSWVDYTPIFTFHAFLYERISNAFSSEDRSYTELALWCVDFLPDQSSMRGFSQDEWATIIWLYISESLTSDQEPHAYESSNQSLKPRENKWTELECNELTGSTLDYGWHFEDPCEKDVGSAYYDARMDWKRPMRTEIFERN